MRKSIGFAISLMLGGAPTGCLLDSHSGDTDPPTTDTETDTGVLADHYRVITELDLTVDAVLPEPASEVVATLRDFSTDPAHTLISLCEAAGVPGIATLRAVLPDFLESRLEGMLDDQITKLALDGVPVTQLAGEIGALGETTLTTVTIDSELAITGARADHQLIALRFPQVTTRSLSLASVPAALTTAATTISHDRDRVVIGDHRFQVPVGGFVWTALEAAVTERFGQDPRALLGAVVDCPAVAAAVANRCVLGVCIGHQAELTEVCERGLDEVVAIVEDKLAALDIDALHFARGNARTVVSGGRVERLVEGGWTAEINVGVGLRPVPAAFTATR